MLNDRQQRTVTGDLSRHPEMCIVYSPAMIEFWRRDQVLSQSPIEQHIEAEFARTAEYDGYFILKRKRFSAQ